MRKLAVTFDFGQTLCELDAAMLSRRLAERGVHVTAAKLDEASPEAWRAYDDAIAAGHGGHPWKILMARLFELTDVPAAARAPVVDWLWTEQPIKNLWRRPIDGMIELCRELRAGGVALGVISNSEGRLAELIEEIGWREDFPVVADSGRLGIEKPGAAIFQWTADRLGVALEDTVHVGDSWGADVDGAVRAGVRAIWFRGRFARELPPNVRRADDADTARAVLAGWGFPIRPGSPP